MQVPSEILHLIFACLPKRDLKSSRLVCKKWDVRSTPLLFNSVFLIARYADIEISEMVTEKYGRFINTLVYSTEHFDTSDAERMSQRVIIMNRSPCFSAHMKQHWVLYETLADEAKEIGHRGQVFNQLCRAFTSVRPALLPAVMLSKSLLFNVQTIQIIQPIDANASFINTRFEFRVLCLRVGGVTNNNVGASKRRLMLSGDPTDLGRPPEHALS